MPRIKICKHHPCNPRPLSPAVAELRLVDLIVNALTFLADAGVPMLFLAFPAAFYLLIPVVAVELFVARPIKHITFRRKFVGVASANLVSTIAGWPLMWYIMVLLQMYVIPGGGGAYGLFTPLRAMASVTLQAAWLIPYEEELYWMVPTAAMVLMVPAFLVSVPIERIVLRFIWRQEPVPQRKRFVWRANLCSYALLLAIGCSWLVYSVVDHRRHPPRKVHTRPVEENPDYIKPLEDWSP